jgi:hypothetical protein
VTDEERPEDTGAEVGSLADEAARLLGALSSFARAHGADVGDGLGAAAGHAADGLRDVNEHLATGAPECTYCPICRVVHAVRQTSPEVRAGLAVASASLLQAAAALLATAVPDERRSAAARGEGIEHIDLGDEWPEDGPE